MTELNRAVVSFFWDNKMTLVARTTLEQPRLRGGFGLCSLDLKAAALHAIWIRRFFSPDPGKWFFFFRHHLRRVFLAEPIVRVFGFESQHPATLRRLPSFYRSVVSSWTRIGGRRDSAGQLVVFLQPSSPPTPIFDVTAAKIYYALARTELPTPRCIAKAPQVSWTAVWESIHLCRFDRTSLDTAWKLTHGVLPTADRLLRFNMAVSPYCFCANLESANHLFFSCPIASRIWFWYSSLGHQYRRDFPQVTDDVVTFSFPRTSAVPRGFQVLAHVIKHQLWLHRNRVRFDFLAADYAELLIHVKSSFRFHLSIQRRHCTPSEFHAQWLAMGTFGILHSSGAVVFASCLST